MGVPEDQGKHTLSQLEDICQQMFLLLPNLPTQNTLSSVAAKKIQSILNVERCFVLFRMDMNVLASEVDGKQIMFVISPSDFFGKIIQSQSPMIVNDVSKD
jgi:hypothetical protein